jgi:glycosyltransferase involved in cell wall biosynthesis
MRKEGAAAVRFLAFNWRDPHHPEAGGAEVHLHEILRRFAARGHEVTQLSSGFAGGAGEEWIDGVRVLRRGTWYDANWTLRRAYGRELRDQEFDLVIDDINKLPFFTPTFVRPPVLAVVPHLFGSAVFAEAAWPLAAYVYAHELFVPRIYRNTDFLVISESTRSDLVSRGLPRERVRVVPVGIDLGTYCPDPEVGKSEIPLILHLGRIRRYKGIQALIEALPAVREKVPAAELWVIGSGPYERELERRARGVAGVRLLGRRSLEEVVDHLRRAWVVASASVKEGWGLTMLEANACGTPTVATRVPGLVDSVVDGETGLLVPYGDQAALAATLVRVLADEPLRRRLGEGGRRFAGNFTWETATDQAFDLAQSVLARRRGDSR